MFASQSSPDRLVLCGLIRARPLCVSLVMSLCLMGCSHSEPVISGGKPTAEVAAMVPPQCLATSNLSATVVGPIPSVTPGDPSRNYPWTATNLDLASYGYVEEEYFFCGFAPAGNYVSRMIVRRPVSAEKFNGAVLAEWLNVTGGDDGDALWLRSSGHIMRAGYAYVGISAQRAGLYTMPNGLKFWSPVRYAQLTIPQADQLNNMFVVDPAAYSIFSQALAAIKTPVGLSPLGKLPVQWLIATGASQSAGTLFIYYDSYQAKDRIADGFLSIVLSQSSLNAGVGNETQINVQYTVDADAVQTPYFNVNSEADPSFVRQPDSAYFRLWEVAGASHGDETGYEALRPILLRDLGVDLADLLKTCPLTPLSRIPFNYVQNVAMDRLLEWIKTGTPPPSGIPFQYDASGQLVRDEVGNVLGGIRLSQHEVATAVNRRENGACTLFGQYVPFTAEQLRSLYPTHDAYVARVQQVTEGNVKAGYLLRDDADETIHSAEIAAIPPP